MQCDSNLILIDKSSLFGGAREQSHSQAMGVRGLLSDPQSRHEVLSKGLHQSRTSAAWNLRERREGERGREREREGERGRVGEKGEWERREREGERERREREGEKGERQRGAVRVGAKGKGGGNGERRKRTRGREMEGGIWRDGRSSWSRKVRTETNKGLTR